MAGQQKRSCSEAEPIAACRAIPIVGLMTMAALGTTAETARGSFVRLRELRDQLQARDRPAAPGACRWGCRTISRRPSKKERPWSG